MYVVTVAFEIRPEVAAAFLSLVLENAGKSLAEEPGCLRFDVCRDEAPDDTPPTRIFLYEIYRDRGAFDAHLASAHFQSFAAATRPMVASKQFASWQLLATGREETEQAERP